MKLWYPSVAITENADEVGTALIDLFEACADDASEACFFLCQPPSEVDVGEGHTPFTTEGADFGKDLFDEMFPFPLQVLEGRGDEDAELVLL